MTGPPSVVQGRSPAPAAERWAWARAAGTATPRVASTAATRADVTSTRARCTVHTPREIRCGRTSCPLVPRPERGVPSIAGYARPRQSQQAAESGAGRGQARRRRSGVAAASGRVAYPPDAPRGAAHRGAFEDAPRSFSAAARGYPGAMQPQETIAVLGAGGTMGRPMARNLAAAGFAVRAWNRSADKLRPLAGDGLAEPCSTPAEAARGARAILTMLSDADAVRDVMEGGDGARWRGPRRAPSGCRRARSGWPARTAAPSSPSAPACASSTRR